MDFNNMITENIPTIIVVVLLVAPLVIFTQRKRLGRFAFKAWGLTFEWNFFELKVDEIISKELKSAGINIEYNENAYSRGEGSDNLSDRDAVIESLSTLSQAIKNLASAKNISAREGVDILTIVDILVDFGILPSPLAGAIRVLFELGKEVRNRRKAKIYLVAKRKYERAIIEIIKKLPPSIPPQTPRKTQVGGGIIGFARPDLGRPAATLYCLSGAFQGQRFPINKSFFKLGANTDNDLIIPNDEYISGSHAHINYDQGSLLLFDDASRNGTFLNGERINSPRMLKLGDKIKLGGYTLELT